MCISGTAGSWRGIISGRTNVRAMWAQVVGSSSTHTRMLMTLSPGRRILCTPLSDTERRALVRAAAKLAGSLAAMGLQGRTSDFRTSVCCCVRLIDALDCGPACFADLEADLAPALESVLRLEANAACGHTVS